MQCDWNPEKNGLNPTITAVKTFYMTGKGNIHEKEIWISMQNWSTENDRDAVIQSILVFRTSYSDFCRNI